jgi:hypothetical protein
MCLPPTYRRYDPSASLTVSVQIGSAT